MRQIKGALAMFMNFLSQTKVKWLALPTAARWLILIVATLFFSKAVVLEQGPSAQFWPIASTFGTLLAAFAAYYTAVTTKAALDNQVQQVEEEKVPNLFVADADMYISLEDGQDALGSYLGPYVNLDFTAGNVSRSAINIYQITFFSKEQITRGVPLLTTKSVNIFIPPNERQPVSLRTRQYFYPSTTGEIYIFFYYGITGHRIHALKWRYISTDAPGGVKSKQLSNFRFSALPDYIAPDAAKDVHRNLLFKHVTGKE